MYTDFNHFYTVTTRNVWRIKTKLPLPLQILLKLVQYCCKNKQLLLGYYREVVLEKGLLSDIRAKYRHHKWTLQQDGAL